MENTRRFGLSKRRWCFIYMLAVWVAGVLPSKAVNGFYLEYYANIPGDTINDLTSADIYPDSPTRESIMERDFQTDTNIGDTYGQRARAFLTPTVSGSYTFYIASDDHGQLWLGADDNPSTKTRIINHSGWSSALEWTKNASQKSSAITLTAGKRYYIEALMKENTGGDNLAVGWVVPDSSAITVIPQSCITPYLEPPVISRQPETVEIDRQWEDIREVTFSVVATRPLGIAFQWFEDGVAIPDATAPDYTLTATASRAEHIFTCQLSNSGGTITSVGATYRLIDDTVPPRWEGWDTQADDFRRLILHFSEPLDADACVPAAFTIAGRETREVHLTRENRSVILVLDTALEPGQTYRLSCSVTDCANPPNTLTLSDSAINVPRLGTLPDRLVRGIVETPGPSSRRSPLAVTEIHAAPAPRSDGKDLRFIEIFNSNPYPHRIGGHTLSGSMTYTFPTNAILPAKGYIVIAASAADIRSVYAITNVVQAVTCDESLLPGTVTLTDEMGAWLTTIAFEDADPWPVGIRGSGHSLVLAAPSYGERAADGWARSSHAVPTPGVADTERPTTHAGILINESL
ncbi:MAG: lamin tail domain-containing protein, partial [Kiritimatiellae bacterium]|nr:lamin tail domain-containing protein [Kiritimatiellia bacterium]